MNEEPKDLTVWLQELTTRSIGEHVQAIGRYNELLTRVAQGELDPLAIRDEYARFVTEESIRYQRNLSTISLSYYNALMDLNREFNERFFERVAAGAAKKDEPPKPIRRVDLPMRGRRGETLRAAFLLENRFLNEVDVAFNSGEFAGGDGVPFRPPLGVSPSRYRLGPKEEIRVDLELLLLPELFAADETYHATVAVLGQDCELALSVAVEKDPEPEPPLPKPRRRRPVRVEPQPEPEVPLVKPRRKRSVRVE